MLCEHTFSHRWYFCSHFLKFHFTDVSEHTNRVRNRMVLLEDVVHVTSGMFPILLLMP